MIIRIIEDVPDNIFNSCLRELSKISWKDVNDDRKSGVFKTSTSIHLRSHKVMSYDEKPESIEEYSAIVDCVDNKFAILKFPSHYFAAHWIKKQVNGSELGRVMIVHLEPKSEIGIHFDPGPYFKKYSRFHIPLKTNQDVQFFNKDGNRSHMPIKTLCQLNNLDYHGLINNSDEERIHLIADVAVDGGNSTF